MLRTPRAPLCFSAAIAGSALAASAALAGPTITVTPIVIEGDIYNGFPISSSFSASENHAVNNLGQWVVESDTTNPDTNADGLVITGMGAMGPRSVLLTEGQSLMFPAGSSLDSFDAITINNLGNGSYNFFLDGTAGTSDDSGVFFNDMLLIQEGTISTAAGFSAGTPYTGWFETLINDQNQIMMMASVDDPAIASTTDRAIVIIDNPTGAFTETVIAKEGDELLPGRFVTDFSTSNRHVMAFRNNSRVLFHANLDGDTLTDGAIFHYDGSTLHLVAQEGSPSAVAGRNWGTLLGAPIDINNSGDWVMHGDLDGGSGTPDDAVIVKNGTQVIAREGDPVPAAVGAFTFTYFGTGGVAIADNGDVIYFATWSDPDTSRNQGIFVNDKLVVQKGVTVIEGQVLSAMASGFENIAASPNGRYIIFEGTLADTRDGAFLIDRGPPGPTIAFLDPNHPDMLVPGSSLPGPQPPDSLLDWSPSRMAQLSSQSLRGAACDGVTRVLVRWPVPGAGTAALSVRDEVGSAAAVGGLSLPGQPSTGTALSNVPAVQVYGQWYIFAEYVVPLDFWRDSSDEVRAFRPAVFSASFTPAAGGAGVQSAATLELVRPPVLLLHGFWSSGDAWSWPLQSDPRFVVLAHDYASNSQSPFAGNIIEARLGVRRAIEKLRFGQPSGRFAVTQATVIGHSMGGLLARLHAGGRGSHAYYRTENLGQGDFYKLITLYTPHFGSGVACLLEEFHSTWFGVVILEQLVRSLCSNCGAVGDLRPDSDQILNLPAFTVPTHAIAGVGGDEVVQAIDVAASVTAYLHPASKGIARVVRLATASYPSLVGSTEHDLLVSNISAFGGLESAACSTVSWQLQAGTPPILSAGVHYGVGSEDYTGDLILRPLVDAPIVGSGRFAAGMPSNSSISLPAEPGICLLRGVPTFEPAENGSIDFTWPTSGTVVAAGGVLQFVVHATGTYQPTSVFVSGLGESLTGNSTPFNGVVNIPPNAVGSYELSAFAIDDQSRMAVATPVLVQVVSASALLSLESLLPWASIADAGERLQLAVRGHFEGPFTRDLTNASAGTEYESSSPSIVTVSPDGQVFAHGAGQARVFIRNGGFEVFSDVIVTALPCRADFDSDGMRGVPDIFAFLSAWFVQAPHADWDYDGAIAVPDIFAFLAAWFAGCE